jgi:hypothetical protein
MDDRQEPVWGKMGEWTMYKQNEQQPQEGEWDSGYEKAMAEKAAAIDAMYGEDKEEKWEGDMQCCEEAPQEEYIQGCLIFYIDVGQLPPFKAEAFVERMKDQLNDRGGLTRIKKHQEVFFVPVRNGKGTRVEYIAFN